MQRQKQKQKQEGNKAKAGNTNKYVPDWDAPDLVWQENQAKRTL
jgi:hypothetical protein